MFQNLKFLKFFIFTLLVQSYP